MRASLSAGRTRYRYRDGDSGHVPDQERTFHLGAWTQDEDGVRGHLQIDQWDEAGRIEAFGQRDSTLVLAAELARGTGAESLKARAAELKALSRSAFDSLLDDAFEDPFRPYDPTDAASVVVTLETLFPIASVDGARISLRRPRMLDGYLEVVASITFPEPRDDGLVTSEWWIRPFDRARTAPELNTALERLADSWICETAENVETAIASLPRARPR